MLEIKSLLGDLVVRLRVVWLVRLDWIVRSLRLAKASLSDRLSKSTETPALVGLIKLVEAPL